MNNMARNAGTPRHAQKITPIRPQPELDDGLSTEFTERAYIAALIRDPDGKKLIAEGITVDHFTRPECREAFTAIALLLADSIQPDAATIAALTDSATVPQAVMLPLGLADPLEMAIPFPGLAERPRV